MDPHQKVIYSIIERFVKGRGEEGKEIGSLTDSLGLREREVISIVGAGGKTTLMFRIARELAERGKKVLTTTTTRILEPGQEESPYLFVHPEGAEIKKYLERHLEQYRHITVASEKMGGAKLKGISPAIVEDLWRSSGIDFMVIEADGAARKPIKAPRENEPVISENTTLVIAVLGVDGLGKGLNEENAFQAERISKMTGVPLEGEITDEAMAILMTHPEGLLKGMPSDSRGVAFLNKVDIPKGDEKAKGIAQKILERKHERIERVVLGQVKHDPPVMDVIFP